MPKGRLPVCAVRETMPSGRKTRGATKMACFQANSGEICNSADPCDNRPSGAKFHPKGVSEMASAWVFQDHRQVQLHGSEAVSWYCGWYAPDGKKRRKSCGKGARGKKLAEQLCKQREAELITGTYEEENR